MDIRSILINIDLETAGSTSLNYAIDLAQTFDAELIGVAADEPDLTFTGADIGTGSTEFYVMERAEIEKRLKAAEAHFRAIVPAGVKSEWRSYLGNSVRSLVSAARRADIIVTASTMSPTYQKRRPVDLGELVISAGRPVIDVANGATKFAAGKIVIGWKDTREARRAVADALPFLKLGKDITAITIGEGEPKEEQRSLDDLVAWLAGHGISAKSELIDNSDGLSDVLQAAATGHEADLLISGGYGHSRMREWILGGVTRSLLKADTITRLLSN